MINLNHSFKRIVAPTLLALCVSQASSATRLGTAMKTLAEDLKTLSVSLANSNQNTENTQRLNSMLLECDKARAEIPPKALRLSDLEKAQFIKAYQLKLDELKAVLIKALDLVKIQENAKAVQLIAEMGNIKKDGHKQFK